MNWRKEIAYVSNIEFGEMADDEREEITSERVKI